MARYVHGVQVLFREIHDPVARVSVTVRPQVLSEFNRNIRR
jgi:hypothetical protein